MADFPENEVQLLDSDYISEAFIDGVQTVFFTADDITEIPSSLRIEPLAARNKLRTIASARGTLLQLFASQVRDNNPAEPIWDNKNRLWQLRDIMTEITRGNFDLAESKLVKLEGLPELRFGFRNAFNTSAVDYELVMIEDSPFPNRPPTVVSRREARLPPYAGPRASSALGERLDAWVQFLSKGAEFDYQINLLKSEIWVGRRKFDEAIKLYNGLFKSSEVLDAIPIGSPRRKFVALRAAFAYLDLGDQKFRKHRVVQDSERESITEHYDQAVRVLEENGVSPDNPLRREVETHANSQRAKLQNNLNCLGLWDAFVPNQRVTELERLATSQIKAAQESMQVFLNFLKDADHEQEKQMDVVEQRRLEGETKAIRALNLANSTLSSEKIREQLKAIEGQQNFLGVNAFLGHARSIIQIDSPGDIVLGSIGNVVNLLDQQQQLDSQLRMAQIELQIAGNLAAIVQAEGRISDLRIELFDQKLNSLRDKRLNADILYEMARLNEKRAERQLEAAIYLAYLYERALTFHLGVTNISLIDFDYLDRPLSIDNPLPVVEAINALAEVVQALTTQHSLAVPGRIDHFTEKISLRETYPIQFNRFLQEGKMDFVYSLYQLSKTRLATHDCRLRQVGVQVMGLLPPTGYSGTLTHYGQFLVRDREATIGDPPVTQLIPTADELVKAVEEQRRLGLATAAVGGVKVYNLDIEAKQLSDISSFVTNDPPSGNLLSLFEGRGPTGLWRLHIIDHGRLAISDIVMHFAIVSRESDTGALQSKVETLIRAYEMDLSKGDQLDKVSRFSLHERFPDVFFALQSGQAQLMLTQDDFEDGLTNLQFKSVIVQALNQQGKAVAGVALEISRSDPPFKLERVTRADGFSEDLDAVLQPLDRDQRFPVIGTWHIRLPNPAQFAQLGDLRLFFMYAFEKV